MNILLTFPGQGSQHLNLLSDLKNLCPILEEKYKTALGNSGIGIEDILTNEPDIIHQTEITQPLILGYSYLLFEHYAKNLKNYSLTFAGHSLGELTAACLSASLTLEESLSLAQKRANLMKNSLLAQEITTSTFALLGPYSKTVESLLLDYDKVWAINFNTPLQTVISGQSTQMESLKKKLSQLESTKRIVPIALSVSSHCPLLEGILPQWRSTLEDAFADKSFTFPIASNIAFTPSKEKEAILKRLTRQLVEPVRYFEMITSQKDIDKILEIGPGKVLTNLHKRMSVQAAIASSEDLVLSKELFNDRP